MRILYRVFFILLLQTGAGYTQVLRETTDQKGQRLQKVTVSASFTEKQDLDTVPSVSIIGQKEIESRQLDHVMGLVSDLPGVDIFGGPNGQGAEFNIRGFNRPERNIVRVDGVTKFFEQYRLGSFFADPELLKQIDVIRGPVSTLYGNGAIGGVVNIVTKDASDFLKPGQKYGVKLKGGYHTNNQEWKGAGYVYARPEENLDLLGVVHTRKSKDYKFASGEKFKGSGLDIKDVLLKAGYTFLDEHFFSLSYHYLYDDNIVEYRQNDRSNGSLDNGFDEGLVKRTLKDYTFSALYLYQPEDNPFVDFEFRMGYSNTENNETGLDPEHYANASPSLPAGQKRLAKYKNWQISLRNITRFDTTKDLKHILTFGADYNIQDRSGREYNSRTATLAPSSSHPSGKQTVYGGFVQDEISFYDRLILTPALRYAQYKTKGKASDWQDLPQEWFADAKTYSAFSPSLSVEVKIQPWVSLIGGYYQGFRAPVIDEIYAHSLFFPNKMTSLALKEETAKTYELGFKTAHQHILTKGDALRTRLIYFDNHLEDKVESVRSDPTRPESYINVGSSKIRGWEFESSYYNGPVYARIAASRLRGKAVNGGETEKIDTIPADKISVSLGSRLEKWKLDFGLHSLFSFKVPASRRPESCSRFGCLAAEDVPAFTTHEIYLIWSPHFLSGLQAHMTISNLFDKDYTRHNSSVRSFGRDFRLSLSWQY